MLLTVFFSQILTIELSIEYTRSKFLWNSIFLIGKLYIWSFIIKGLFDLISYSSTCPLMVPTPNVKPPWHLRAVIAGNVSKLKDLKSFKLRKSLNSPHLLTAYLLFCFKQLNPQSRTPTLFLTRGSQASTLPSSFPTSNSWCSGLIVHLFIAMLSDIRGCIN